MANNRLYVGDPDTKRYMFLEKGWGVGWDGGYLDSKRVEMLREFLAETYEGDSGDKTSLIFFSEYDAIYSQAVKEWLRTDKKDASTTPV